MTNAGLREILEKLVKQVRACMNTAVVDFLDMSNKAGRKECYYGYKGIKL